MLFGNIKNLKIFFNKTDLNNINTNNTNNSYNVTLQHSECDCQV